MTFEFKKIGEIREGDEYTGYRVSLSANYPPMAVPLKLDITTGDKITPKEIEYRFKLLLEDREISVLAYNLETVMAEKLETVVSRGDQNTRPRDYYDVYILAKLQYKNIEKDTGNITLEITTDSGWFELQYADEAQKYRKKLWYKNAGSIIDDWKEAEQGEHGERIPAEAFEYIKKSGESLIEGSLLIALTDELESPDFWNSCQLEVEIW